MRINMFAKCQLTIQRSTLINYWNISRQILSLSQQTQKNSIRERNELQRLFKAEFSETAKPLHLLACFTSLLFQQTLYFHQRLPHPLTPADVATTSLCNMPDEPYQFTLSLPENEITIFTKQFHEINLTSLKYSKS